MESRKMVQINLFVGYLSVLLLCSVDQLYPVLQPC